MVSIGVEFLFLFHLRCSDNSTKHRSIYIKALRNRFCLKQHPTSLNSQALTSNANIFMCVLCFSIVFHLMWIINVEYQIYNARFSSIFITINFQTYVTIGFNALSITLVNSQQIRLGLWLLSQMSFKTWLENNAMFVSYNSNPGHKIPGFKLLRNDYRSGTIQLLIPLSVCGLELSGDQFILWRINFFFFDNSTNY